MSLQDPIRNLLEANSKAIKLLEDPGTRYGEEACILKEGYVQTEGAIIQLKACLGHIMDGNAPGWLGAIAAPFASAVEHIYEGLKVSLEQLEALSDPSLDGITEMAAKLELSCTDEYWPRYAATLREWGQRIETAGKAAVQPVIDVRTAPVGQLAQEDANDQSRIPAELITCIEYENRADGLYLRVKHTGGCVEHTISPHNGKMTKQASLLKLLFDNRGNVSMAGIANALYVEEYKTDRTEQDLKNFPKVVRSLCTAINKRLGANLIEFHHGDMKGAASISATEIVDLEKQQEDARSRKGTLNHRERGNM